jgi:hypothetical protein
VTARTELETSLAALRGRILRRAQVMGAWTTAFTEPEAYVEWIVLELGAGTVRFTTEPIFGDYGVELFEGGVDAGAPLKSTDVTSSPPWAAVVGRPIAAASVGWRTLLYAAGAAPGELPEYPSHVWITFEGGAQVVLAAAALDKDGTLVFGVDSLLALGAEEARALGIP